MKLTTRDREILSALCNHVRMFSLQQIAEHWWQARSTAQALARKRLEILQSEQLVTRQRVLARKLPEILEPLVCWKPGEADPEFGALAWKLQKRWDSEPKLTTVYLATKSASSLFGGVAKGTLRREYQASHDLGLSEMYLRMKQLDSELLQYWVGEDVLAPHRRAQKLPDAVIAAIPGATPQLVLEFGGAYDKARLLEFHSDCKARRLPYEIW